jgi:hypothetical protein
MATRQGVNEKIALGEVDPQPNTHIFCDDGMENLDAADLFDLADDIEMEDISNTELLADAFTDDFPSTDDEEQEQEHVIKSSPFPDMDPRRALMVREITLLIFENLDYENLLNCRKVCTHWRAAFPYTSMSFMTPIARAPFVPFYISPGIPLAQVDLLREAWEDSLNTPEECDKSCCDFTRVAASYTDLLDQHNVGGIAAGLGTTTDFDLPALPGHLSVHPRHINPIFTELALNDHTCLKIKGSVATFVVYHPGHIQKLLDLHARSDVKAIWREAFLTNPPVKVFQAHSDIPGDVPSSDRGIKMGEVVDMLVYMFRREVAKQNWCSERTERVLNSRD